MPYIADLNKANAFVKADQLVGNGQCVTFVHAVATIPATSVWAKGALVKGSKSLLPGTVIATFDADGHYGNHTDGSSHAAIYLGEVPGGILVLDQWKGRTAIQNHAPQQRTIRFKNGRAGAKVDDGDQYYVVQ